MKSSQQRFTKSLWIIKDVKTSNTLDVIKIISKIDEQPVLFDFGAGNVLVNRFMIETIDGLMNLYIPSIKSFISKIKVGRFFELTSRRCFSYEMGSQKCEWIIYVNRIKNLNEIDLKLADRLLWVASEKSTLFDFPFDENWLDKSLPIRNNLVDCHTFFDSIQDIDVDTLLGIPLKILQIREGPKIEIIEDSGSIIKNLQFTAMNHNCNYFRLYIPYFLKDLTRLIFNQLAGFNLIVNRLKVFYKWKNKELLVGFLWDPTLSGFIFEPKEEGQSQLPFDASEDLFDTRIGSQSIDAIIHNYKVVEHQLSSKKTNIVLKPNKPIHNKAFNKSSNSKISVNYYQRKEE
jgi:hypothetical protein